MPVRRALRIATSIVVDRFHGVERLRELRRAPRRWLRELAKSMLERLAEHDPSEQVRGTASGAPRGAQTGLLEHREVTIMFADVDEQTAEFAHDRDDGSDSLAAHMDSMRAQVDRFGGATRHALGGTIMAVFGLAGRRQDDPERAVRAALAIRQVLLSPAGSAGSATRPDASQRSVVQLRISVATGEALVETVNGDTRIAGDLVRLGSLLMQAAPPGTVMVSHDTQRATTRSIRYAPPSLLSLRGRAKPTSVYSALEPRDEPIPRSPSPE